MKSSDRRIAEGRVVHPNVPVAVVQGPLPMAQILESALLNHLSYQMLVATKASRIREAGRGQAVLEFGMRRRRDADLDRLDPGVKRLVNPHTYHVSLSQPLWMLKQDLIEKARKEGG